MRQRGDHLLKWSIVTEGFADVGEVIDVSGAEDECATKLKRVFAQFVLAVSGSLGPPAGCGIIAPQEMEEVGLLQAKSAIACERFVNQKRKINTSLLSKRARIFSTAESDRDNARTPRRDLLFMRAQLRDVLTAEDSAPMTKEDDDRRLL